MPQVKSTRNTQALVLEYAAIPPIEAVELQPIEEASPATPALWNWRYGRVDYNFSSIKTVIDALLAAVVDIEDEIDSGVGGFMFDVKPWFGSNEAVPDGYFLASGVIVQEADSPGIVALVQGTGQPWIAEAEWRANAAQRGKWGIGDGFVITPDFNGEYVAQAGEPASIGGVFLGGGVFALVGSLHGSQNLSHSHGGSSGSSGGSGSATIGAGWAGDFGTFRESTADQTVSGWLNNRHQGSSGGGSYYYATINLANHTHTFTLEAQGSDESRPRTVRTRWVIQCFGGVNTLLKYHAQGQELIIQGNLQRIERLESQLLAMPVTFSQNQVERFANIEYFNCSDTVKTVSVEFEATQNNACLTAELKPLPLRKYVPKAGMRGNLEFKVKPWQSYKLLLSDAVLIHTFETEVIQ